MKYIRTETGIHKLKGAIVKKLFPDINFNQTLFSFREEYIQRLEKCKQADTIEELCDEFVSDHFVCKDLKQLLEYIKLGNVMGTQIYGAIWINGEHDEPILKSVAKMNDKGELELL